MVGLLKSVWIRIDDHSNLRKVQLRVNPLKTLDIGGLFLIFSWYHAVDSHLIRGHVYCTVGVDTYTKKRREY